MWSKYKHLFSKLNDPIGQLPKPLLSSVTHGRIELPPPRLLFSILIPIRICKNVHGIIERGEQTHYSYESLILFINMFNSSCGSITP